MKVVVGHILLGLSLIFSTKAVQIRQSQESTDQPHLQDSIQSLIKDENQDCLKFIDDNTAAMFPQSPGRKANLEEKYVKWCFESQDPLMAYDLKIIECLVVMHQFAAYQGLVAIDAMDEQSKLANLALFCDYLEMTLQFRDDLLAVLSLSGPDTGMEICQEAFTGQHYYTYWIWDQKDVLINPSVNDTCTDLLTQLQDGTEPSALAIGLALEGFIQQLVNKLDATCSSLQPSVTSLASPFELFKRQCSQILTSSQILILYEDDQIDQLCNTAFTPSVSAEPDPSLPSDCESGAWYITGAYYKDVLWAVFLDFQIQYLQVSDIQPTLSKIEGVISTHTSLSLAAPPPRNSPISMWNAQTSAVSTSTKSLQISAPV